MRAKGGREVKVIVLGQNDAAKNEEHVYPEVAAPRPEPRGASSVVEDHE